LQVGRNVVLINKSKEKFIINETKTNMKTMYLFVSVIFILIIGCSSQMEEKAKTKLGKTDELASSFAKDAEETEGDMAPPPPPIVKKANEFKEVQKKDVRKIIKTADASIEVEKFKEMKPEITKVIQKWQAYISKENEVNNNYKISNTLEIRVPGENFEKLLDELVSLGKKVDYKKIDANDVTEEYYDIQARMESNKKLEQSYFELLKKAYSMGDILQIQEKLGQIREEIEAKEGRLKHIDDRANYSTVSLFYYELLDYKYIPQKNPGFFERLAKALHSGWTGLVTILIGIFYLWPLWLVLGIGFYFFRRYLKRTKKK